VTRQEARTVVRIEFGGELLGADGSKASFTIDGSLRSWWVITRWNIGHRHWHAIGSNVRDLFGKVLWRRMW